MPFKPNKPCARQPCPVLVPAGQRYCPAHQRQVNQDYERYQRPASHQFYHSPEWRKLRAEALEVLGDSCVMCGSKEHVQFDHIIPILERPDLKLVLENLRPLCRTHHSRTTARQRKPS